MMPFEEAVAVANQDPSSWAARNAVIDLHRQCRADTSAAIQIAGSGGVGAAVAVLTATGGAEALGLLWTLSACKGTLQFFTLDSLEAVVRTGRDAGDGWRRTAALSTMHNLLCYDGHDLVLSSSAGSLELAVEILKSDASPSVKSAASKLLDQCCFDERSKLAAVNLLPVRVVADILRNSLSRGCKGAVGSSEEAHERALLVLVEDTLSLLWNASDDVFFSRTSDWLRVTALLCEPSLLEALCSCLRSPMLCHQQAASATLHNMASNTLLLPQLVQAGVATVLSKLAQHAAPSSICAILAVTELCGMSESMQASKDGLLIFPFSDALIATVVHELDRRVAVCASSDDDSKTARLQEVVGTRKLVSAIDVLSSRADSKIPLMREGAISVIVAALQQRRTDERGSEHCINVLTHLSLDPSCKLAMQRAHPDLLPTLRHFCADHSAAIANAARALMFSLLHLDLLTRPERSTHTWRSVPPCVALLSYHDAQAELARGIRSGLQHDKTWRLCAVDDLVCGGDFERTVSELEMAQVLVVLVSRALKRSARSRLVLNIAARRGVFIVPLLAVDGYVPDGWLAALAGSINTTTMAAQIPPVGSPVTEARLVSGLLAFLHSRASGQVNAGDAASTPLSNVEGGRGSARDSEGAGEGAEKHPSFMATIAAGFVNALSPRGMPATPRGDRGDVGGPSPSPRLGLLLKQNYQGGDVFVSTVVPGGMAARTGAIREGDVITRVDACTTAGLSVLAVTELIRGLPLSEPKARARAADSRAMVDGEVRITLRRNGRPLEAVIPRLASSSSHTPSSPAVASHPISAANTSSASHKQTGGENAAAAHRGSQQQSKYNEDAVPPHLRARAGTHSGRAHAPAEKDHHHQQQHEQHHQHHQHHNQQRLGSHVASDAQAVTSKPCSSHAKAPPSPSARRAQGHGAGAGSERAGVKSEQRPPPLQADNGGGGGGAGAEEHKGDVRTETPLTPPEACSVAVPSLFGKGPFSGALNQHTAPDKRLSSLNPSGLRTKEMQTATRATATHVAVATGHESNSEEWVESSSEGSQDSCDDDSSDVSSDSSPNGPARGTVEDEEWEEGEVKGSIGLKPRPPDTHISFRKAPLSLELVWNLRTCITRGGWISPSAARTKQYPLLACVLREESWETRRMCEAEGSAEGMTHAKVLAWLARCDLAEDWEQSFQEQRVDGHELRKLFTLFRCNVADYLARIKSQHGVAQYGVALSLGHELSQLFDVGSASSKMSKAAPVPVLREIGAATASKKSNAAPVPALRGFSSGVED